MNDAVFIRVTGHPTAKGRARTGKNGNHYTPAKTRSAERDVRMLARQAMGARLPMAGPLVCGIVATFAVPKSWPKWKRELALAGGVAHTAKPDKDNIEKLLCDACNGVVWLDDAQIVAGSVCKTYGEAPGVEIRVMPQRQACSQTKTRAELQEVNA